MAEGNTIGGQNPTRFFCHQCKEEIPQVTEDFTCPRCKGGFIEEMQEDSTSQADSGVNIDLGGGADFFQMLMRGLSDPSGGSGGGASVRFQGPNYQRTRSEGASPGSNSQSFSFVLDATRPPGGGGRGAGGQNAGSDNPMEHMLFTFLNDLVTGLGGGAAVGGAPILSNFGDYVWGRDGLDQIVTQLMNQMEGTGPPPLGTEKIDTLPDFKVTQEEVDRKLQCSVCWDDFKLGEDVKQLECDHLYHPDCIIPWLKLHGTCPICRKDLTGQVKEDTNASPSPRFEPNVNNISATSSTTSSNNVDSTRPSAQSNTNTTGGFLEQLLENLTGNAGSNSSRPSGANPANRGSGGRGNQGPDNRFDNMDMEFD